MKARSSFESRAFWSFIGANQKVRKTAGFRLCDARPASYGNNILAVNRHVGGSNPPRGANPYVFANLVETLPIQRLPFGALSDGRLLLSEHTVKLRIAPVESAR